MFPYNGDEVSRGADQAAPGPREGFIESMASAYDTGTKGTMPSIYQGMEGAYSKQNQTLRDLGEYNAPVLNVTAPGDIAKYYSTEDEKPNFNMKDVEDYDTKITELQQKHPNANLRTTRDMWSGVQQDYTDSLRADAEQQRTFGGKVGAFIGGMGAAIDPRYNLFNFVTMPLAGGETALARIGAQAGIQSVAETADEFTGNRQARRMLGGDTSAAGTLERIAGAAAGGAVGQGVGEVIGKAFKGAKRWFNDTPDDPAPPPGPGAPPANAPGAIDNLRAQMLDEGLLREPKPSTLADRLMSSRAGYDIEHVRSRLEAWDGETGDAVRPPDGVTFSDGTDTRSALNQLTVDERAREIDPQLFDLYDRMAKEKTDARAELDTLRGSAEPIRQGGMDTISHAVQDLTDRIDGLTSQLDETGVSKRRQRDLTAQVEQLTQERADNMQRVEVLHGPGERSARERVTTADETMRSLAPAVSRAYARARGEWNLSQEYKDAVKDMVRSGAAKLPKGKGESPVSFTPPDPSRALSEQAIKAPLLRDAASVEKKMRPDSTAADYAHAIVQTQSKLLDDKLETFRQGLAAIVKPENKEITLAGTDLKLHLDGDKIHMLMDDGSEKLMSVRDILKDTLDKEHELQAVSTCST